MTFLVFAWGVSEACMAASVDYRGIYVTRFFLGLFEAGYVSTTLYSANADEIDVYHYSLSSLLSGIDDPSSL